MDLHYLSKILGLTSIGTAPAHGIGDEYARLLDWMSHGYHGNMAWLAKSAKKRCDPAHVMAEPKSVIVCAMKYEDMPKRNVKFQNPNFKQISNNKFQTSNKETYALPKYLQYEDYHIIMMQKLAAVAAALKAEHPDMRYKCYVDTGPILEKAWGVLAGIGFIGKNTLLISPEYGSQMALGVIVTSIPLLCKEGAGEVDIDPTLTLPLRRGGNSCSSCTACIDACPTKALISPYILDARKCISYKFFIEKQQGGCDICQDVCPFNSKPD